MFDQSGIRVRPGTTTDRGGNTVPDWTTATRSPIGQLSIQPTIEHETTTDSRTKVVTGWHVLSAPGTNPDLLSSDRVEFDGMLCQVIGEVARWPDPLGPGVHHIEFSLRRVTG